MLKDLLKILTAGSVDDGKSTMIGRLLYDRDLLYDDHLEALKKASSLTGSAGDNPDFALLCDGLKAEREQGITIDVAYRYFATDRRKFIIADCPGHEQYTRNMATGASTAELAIILVDAQQGVLPQTRRHSFIATLLGIRHIVVAINKMDLVSYQKDIYEKIKEDYSEFAAKLEVNDVHFIPISALMGDNVVNRSQAMFWYNGSPLLDYLESVHVASDRNFLDFRFPVQCVIRPDHSFRGYGGTVMSGLIREGDEVVAMPSGKKTKVLAIHTMEEQLKEAFPPLAVTIEVEDDIDISRGDVLVKPNNLPSYIGDQIEAMVVWMDESPLKAGDSYLIKHQSQYVPCTIDGIRYRVNVNTTNREPATNLRINEIGRVLLSPNKPLMLDSYSRNRSMGCFILIDRMTNVTSGAAMAMSRQTISTTQKKPGFCVWLTGLSGSGKSTIAEALYDKLLENNIKTEMLDGDVLRERLCKDLGYSKEDRKENIDRAMFVAELLARNGVAVIASFISPHAELRDNGKQTINNFVEAYVKCSIEECERRDPKGLYKKVRNGEIDNFTGIDDLYEEPLNPDLVLETEFHPIEYSVKLLIDYLVDNKLLPQI